MQSLAWRALRVASRDNLHLFGKLDRPEDIEGLLKVMEEERDPKRSPCLRLQRRRRTMALITAEASLRRLQVVDLSKLQRHPEGQKHQKQHPRLPRTTRQQQPTLSRRGGIRDREGATNADVSEAAKDPSDIPVTIPPVPTEQASQQEEGPASTDAAPAAGTGVAKEEKEEATNPTSGCDATAEEGQDVEMGETSHSEASVVILSSAPIAAYLSRQSLLEGNHSIADHSFIALA